MTSMQVSKSAVLGVADPDSAGRRGWDCVEVCVGFALILLTVWTPRPLQRWFYLTALLWILLSTCIAFPGWRAMGFRSAGFLRSLWVVGVALLVAFAAVTTASRLHTLHEPGAPVQWVMTFGGYAVWSFVQQFLLQGYFLLRMQRLVPSPSVAAITAASIFAVAHLPNPILTPMSMLWGVTACFVFLRFRNLYPLAVAHAIFGICVAITIPGPVVHNMRVGLGYLTYRAPRQIQPHQVHLSQSDHTVSTDAWVMAEAPTRR